MNFSYFGLIARQKLWESIVFPGGSHAFHPPHGELATCPADPPTKLTRRTGALSSPLHSLVLALSPEEYQPWTLAHHHIHPPQIPVRGHRAPQCRRRRAAPLPPPRCSLPPPCCSLPPPPRCSPPPASTSAPRRRGPRARLRPSTSPPLHELTAPLPATSSRSRRPSAAAAPQRARHAAAPPQPLLPPLPRLLLQRRLPPFLCNGGQ